MIDAFGTALFRSSRSLTTSGSRVTAEPRFSKTISTSERTSRHLVIRSEQHDSEMRLTRSELSTKLTRPSLVRERESISATVRVLALLNDLRC